MKTVLFVCTGNAGRSQMAEAMFKALAPEGVTILSAGVDPWDDLHPMARKLMAEKGLDLAGHHPKHVRDFADSNLEVVVTIGDRADAESPDFRTGVCRIHWAIDDPADADGTPGSESVFRSTCQQIEDRLPTLEELLGSLPRRLDASWAPAISTVIFATGQFDPAAHIPLLADTGFRHIELCCYRDTADFPWTDERAVAELKRVVDDCGVTVFSIHPPDRGNLASEDESRREEQIDVLRQSIDVAGSLGAASLSIHAGYGLPEEEARAIALERQNGALAELEAYAAPSPVALCLETLPERPSDMTNEALFALVRERSAAAYDIVLDTGHSHMAGDLDGLAVQAGRRLRNLHLHDNNGQSDQHRLPGDGTTDWASFMRDLRKCGYEGPLMLEVGPAEESDLEDRLTRCRESVGRLTAYAEETGE